MTSSEFYLCKNAKNIAVEVLVIMRQKLKNAPLFLFIDSKNKGLHHIAKVLVSWDYKPLCFYQINTNTILSANEEAAVRVYFSFQKVDFSNSKVILYQHAADAGGSGASIGLVDKL